MSRMPWPAPRRRGPSLTPICSARVPTGGWWPAWTGHETAGLVTSVYWKAADVIFERVAATGRDQDTLVYPYLMCWRHFVEMQLKNLIVQSRRYLEDSIELPRGPTGWMSSGARA